MFSSITKLKRYIKASFNAFFIIFFSINFLLQTEMFRYFLYTLTQTWLFFLCLLKTTCSLVYMSTPSRRCKHIVFTKLQSLLLCTVSVLLWTFHLPCAPLDVCTVDRSIEYFSFMRWVYINKGWIWVLQIKFWLINVRFMTDLCLRF